MLASHFPGFASTISVDILCHPPRRRVHQKNWRRGRESARKISASVDISMSYNNLSFITRVTQSPDVSIFLALLSFVSVLRGHILGTKTYHLNYYNIFALRQ